MIARIVLTVLVAASWVWWVFACVVTWRFFRRSRAPGPGVDAYTPPVSILKPVKGIDPEAFRNYASFCEQDYPEFELLFGVADADDPAVAVITRLRHHYPNLNVRLLVAPTVWRARGDWAASRRSRWPGQASCWACFSCGDRAR
jgi:ceramide glucosyltransferase